MLIQQWLALGLNVDKTEREIERFTIIRVVILAQNGFTVMFVFIYFLFGLNLICFLLCHSLSLSLAVVLVVVPLTLCAIQWMHRVLPAFLWYQLVFMLVYVWMVNMSRSIWDQFLLQFNRYIFDHPFAAIT